MSRTRGLQLDESLCTLPTSCVRISIFRDLEVALSSIGTWLHRMSYTDFGEITFYALG